MRYLRRWELNNKNALNIQQLISLLPTSRNIKEFLIKNYLGRNVLGGICILDFFTEDEIKERVRNYMWGLAGKKPSQNNYITIEVSDVMQTENVNDTVTENNDSEPENNKSLSIEVDSSKSIIDTLSQFGFEYIDNEASSEIIWVIYDNTKNDIIEEIKTIYKKQIILEKRGSVKTNNRAAWRIMCKNQGEEKNG